MRRLLIPALLILPLLSACSGEQTTQLQQAASSAIGALDGNDKQSLEQLKNQASAAIGDAKQQLKDSSAPLGQLKQQASAAIGVAKRLGDAAIILNPELKGQVDELKQQASAVKEAAAALQGK
ncbi:hypothetical protein [Craterilacuibacter sp. RT1T]|uniref:hypothetical protein n=1 Tax=Craterilacuibacter sp. RT1T TaxID=2942211 RepID=UPI0020C05457|nr:hypothetical protein [Craterilacuibacter sp. RT1T]MCL6262417.1 hypothetical protein [Craterilacuibacter sp. RT1T]